MGNMCCRQWDELEFQTTDKQGAATLNLSFSDTAAERVGGDKKLAASTQDASDTLSRYSESSAKISHIQAWVRGRAVRRVRPPNAFLKPSVIIKYVTCQLRGISKNPVNGSMEPFEVEWDMNAYKGKLELRKMEKDEYGNVHIGYWNVAKNTKEGYGQEVYTTGARYEGFWLDNEYDGRGRYLHENGDCYAGTWRKGRADGFGTFIGVDGMKYTGEWSNDEHHGKGREVWTDGSIFEGTYVHGEKEGHGCFVWLDKSYYEGGFVHSMMCGEGSVLLNSCFE